MNVKWLILFVITSTFFCVEVKAQVPLSTKSKKAIGLYMEADNFRVRGEFDRAIDLLMLALSKDKNFEEAYYRLGITYKNKEDILKSTKNFEAGFKLVIDSKRRRDYIYELAHNYLKTGRYTQSSEMAIQFLKEEKMNTLRGDQMAVWKMQADYALSNVNEKYNYRYAALSDSVNRYINQYFPALTADNSQLFFTIRRGSGVLDNEDIVVARKDTAGNWQRPISVSDKINSKLQEGACSISADGRKLIFTMCGGVNYGRCDLFESKKVGGEWSKPTNLGPLVNSAEWEGQPALSVDGRTLYFASSRKGGLGGYDLWVTKLDDMGKWTKAQNLGNSINTKFDEISPFIHANNQTLYFSSNGYAGFGGYDVYNAYKAGSGWSSPRNLGAPLNDFEDQFSFFVTSDGTEAYFSKADVANGGFSKIYKAAIPPEVQVSVKSFSVKGIVRDSETKKPIKSSIELSSQKNSEKVAQVESDSVNGSYLFVLNKGFNYSLFVSAEGYLFQTFSFEVDSTKASESIMLNIELKPVKQKASAILKNIFFDYDKYEIKTESYAELGHVVRFLLANPTLLIEVAGHTDNEGSEEYNRKLSQKRAQAIVDFLAKKGIDKAKMAARGYGSTRPLVDNNLETNRQLNRRIEFVVLK
jgi:OmpA-OmpF porin, OOP family